MKQSIKQFWHNNKRLILFIISLLGLIITIIKYNSSQPPRKHYVVKHDTCTYEFSSVVNYNVNDTVLVSFSNTFKPYLTNVEKWKGVEIINHYHIKRKAIIVWKE